jgi:hypothetical protein
LRRTDYRVKTEFRFNGNSLDPDSYQDQCGISGAVLFLLWLDKMANYCSSFAG